MIDHAQQVEFFANERGQRLAWISLEFPKAARLEFWRRFFRRYLGVVRAEAPDAE